MPDRERREQLLRAHRARQARQAAADAAAAVVAKIRAWFYPKQLAFLRSPAKRRATKKTRRSGATAGGCRELVARCMETAGYRATYITDTKVNARKRAWKNDTSSGFYDVVRRYGTAVHAPGVPQFDLGGVTVRVRDGDMALEFSNGSQIEIFGADDERAINDIRGLAKHVFWIDEAQDVRFLESLYKSVIVPAMSDFEGECWLTGTPSRDLAGMFYEVTRDDGDPLTGWDVHRIAVVDNPFFGCVVWRAGQWFVVDNLGRETGPFENEAVAEEQAIKVRWEQTAGAAIRANGWDEDDPDLLREWYARWVVSDARFVYAAHKVPEHQLTYAPMRLSADGFPDLRAALSDLPGYADRRQYLVGVGADLGTTRAFAWSAWAWSLMDPVLYELATWKRTGLDYDEMANVLRQVGDQLPVSMWVADAGGGKPAVAGWSKRWVDRYQLPIIEATKPNKVIGINQFNTDIRRGHALLRVGSPLLTEWRTHRWLPLRTSSGDTPGGMVEDPKTHRDCSDAALYIHRDSYHHRYREAEKIPLPGTPEHLLREEQELEQNAQADRNYW